MKKRVWIGLLACFVLPLTVSAQSPFDGTRKFDMNKAQFSEKPGVYLLQDGMYECKTCAPAYKINADGQDHKVTGHPYYDTRSIKIVDDHTIESTRKKDAKINGTSKWTVSSDGNTLTVVFSDSSATTGAPLTGTWKATRVAKGPDGSHTISGSWRTSKMENLSENGLLLTFKVAGNTLNMSTPTGQSYAAKWRSALQGRPRHHQRLCQAHQR